MTLSRWWILVAATLTACTTTRTVSSFEALEGGGHSNGFALKTTSPFRSRVDAASTLYLQSKDGKWTDAVPARDAYADKNGIWLEYDDVMMWKVLDHVELDGANPILGTLLAATQPTDAKLIHARGTDHYVLEGEHDTMRAWLHDVWWRTLNSESEPLHATVRSIRGTNHQGYARTLNNTSFHIFLAQGASAKYGWFWDDVAAVKVQNYSAGKTFAGSIGIAAASVALLPLALIGGKGGSFGGHGGGSIGAVGTTGLQIVGNVADAAMQPDAPNPTQFEDTIAPVPVAGSARMFTTAQRVHTIIRGTLALDSSAAFAGDHVGAGLVAKVRLGEMFELGAGAREVATHDAMGWRASTTPVIAANWHLSLDANYRFAIPIGFEVSWGGQVAHDVRFPIGLRYTTRDGRYFGTLYPATPQHMRVDTEKNGRWSYATSLELGVTF